MSRGWTRQELLDFLNGLKTVNKENKNFIKTYIFRGPVVENQFGKIEEPPKDKAVVKAFLSKKLYFYESNNIYRYAFPLIAKISV